MKKLFFLIVLCILVGGFVFSEGAGEAFLEGAAQGLQSALQENSGGSSNQSRSGIYGNPDSFLGRYSYGVDYYLDFGGRTNGQPVFDGRWGGSGFEYLAHGTYSISGNTLTMNFTRPERLNVTWTIVNSSTLKDHDGDFWYLE